MCRQPEAGVLPGAWGVTGTPDSSPAGWARSEKCASVLASSSLHEGAQRCLLRQSALQLTAQSAKLRAFVRPCSLKTGPEAARSAGCLHRCAPKPAGMWPHNDQRCRAVFGGTRPTMGTTRPLPAAVVPCPRGAVRAPVAGAVPTASRIEEYAAGLVEAMPRVGQNQARRTE